MSKRSTNINPNQKLKTRIPSQKSIAAFFGAKSSVTTAASNQPGTLTNPQTERHLSPIENTNNIFCNPKRQKRHHEPNNPVVFGSKTDTLSPNESRSSFDNEIPNPQLMECIILDSPDKENIAISADENNNIVYDIDDEYLLLVASDNVEEQLCHGEDVNVKNSLENLPPTDLIRGRIADIKRNEQSVELTLTEGNLPEKTSLDVVLGGYWTESLFEVGDTCHVVLDNESQLSDGDKPVIDDSTNMFVLHPDTLVSATSLVGALNCLRQTVLNDKFPFPSVSIHSPTTNKAMLIGKAVHLLFQWALIQRVNNKHRPLNESLLATKLKEILASPEYLQDLYSIGQTSADEITAEIKSLYIPTIVQFSTSSVGELSGVRDIEENVWSPRFGLKGKIDASINIIAKGSKGVSSLVPLELKTGQASKSREHFGQAMLYNLTLADRYGRDVVPDFGLLSYLKNGNKDSVCIKVPRAKSAIQGLMQTRNELAHFLAKPWSREASFLPPPTLNERTCSWCPQSVNCALMHLADPDETARSNRKVTSVVSKVTSTFTDEEVAFWVRWMEILNAEYGQQENVEKWLRKFWSSSLDEMEACGTALGHLELRHVSEKNNDGVLETDCRLEFTRFHGFNLPEALSSATSPFSELFSQDDNFRPRMLISSGQPGDRKFVGLAFGTLERVTNTNGQLSWFLTAEKNFKKLYPEIAEYRLDVVSSSFSSGFSYKMGVSNMSTLFDNLPDFTRLRSLIMGHRLPQRRRGLKRNDLDQLSAIPSLRRLTRLQKEVVLRVLTAEDYLLVRGYPGTGKSTTIAALIRCLLAVGQSVILASYTNTAVDSILVKLMADFSKCDQSKILRIGPIDRINPAIHRFAERNRLPSVKTLSDLNDLYETAVVVAGTCHALFNHPLFSRRKFSVCIVDEASQTLLPTCLGPLLCAERFVLVGDPNQLSPLIVNATSQAADLPLSLLEHLLAHCEKRAPEAVCDLTEQFRMNCEILRIPNSLYYKNRLSCSSKETDKVVSLEFALDRVLLDQSPALAKVCSSELLDSFVFLDTSNFLLSSQVLSSLPLLDEFKASPRTSNVNEALVVAKIVRLLLRCGVPSSEIGVISPFTDQVRLIGKLLDAIEPLGVEVNTVDQYQGREKAVIVVSFVKTGKVDSSSSSDGVKGILTNGKRLNVALTRAKQKLIAVGSRHYLCASFSPIADMVALLRSDQIFAFDSKDFNCLSQFLLS